MRNAALAKAFIDDRQTAMAAISAAVAGMHRQAQRDRPEWFWHLLKRCETKAARIAEQAAQAEDGNGDAIYIDVFADTLPTLFAQAMQRLDNFVAESSGR